MTAGADCPLLVVGCHFDEINAQTARSCVPASTVQKYLDLHCGRFKCYKYFSCSALNGSGLEDVFQAIVYTTVYKRAKQDELNKTLSSKITKLKHFI